MEPRSRILESATEDDRNLATKKVTLILDFDRQLPSTSTMKPDAGAPIHIFSITGPFSLATSLDKSVVHTVIGTQKFRCFW